MSRKIQWYSTKGVRDYNEDEYSIKKINKSQLLCAVYDGHGGNEISAYLKKYLTGELYRNIKIASPSISKLKQIFKLLTKKVNNYAKKYKCNAGSTALTCYLSDQTLIVANIGDCRAVICTDGLAIPLTKDHKPGLREEMQRLKELGGHVIYDKHIKGYRVEGMSVSRSFGDLDRQPYIIAKPDIYRYNIKKNDQFIIMATDGLWDVMTNQEAVEIVKSNYKNGAKVLANKAIEKKSSDNITIIIIFL
tara:strand:+ start:6410 stop:7153 length:744 start_codon:yes stop_codon:yes gene_type:complete